MPDTTADNSAQNPTQDLAYSDDFAAFEKWRQTPEDEPAVAADHSDDAQAAEPVASEPAPDSDPDEDDQEPDDQKPKSKRGLEKRFEKLTGKIRDLEAKLAEKSGEKPTEKTGAASPPAAETNGEPDPEKFETYAQYVAALTDYRIEQREQAKAKAEAERVAKDAQAAAQKAYTDRETAFRTKHPDYDDVTQAVNLPRTPAVPAVAQALLESEVGPALLYHLATNPDEITRIAALSPARAVAELGKLEAKFETAAPVTKTPPITRAPKPPSPVTGTGRGSVDLTDPDLSFADFEKLRNRQLRRA